MLRQMESVLCGRFAVTNKIADNLPFSPHRQQKTSIIVDFHGAALMCHIPALGLHVKIKFHFKKVIHYEKDREQFRSNRIRRQQRRNPSVHQRFSCTFLIGCQPSGEEW